MQELEAKIQQYEREYSDLEVIWKSEKAALQGTQHLKAEIERARQNLKRHAGQ